MIYQVGNWYISYQVYTGGMATTSTTYSTAVFKSYFVFINWYLRIADIA